MIPGADKCGLKRTQWETLHRLPSHEGDLADCNDSKQRRLTSMNDNESAAAPTTYVGAAAKLQGYFTWQLLLTPGPLVKLMDEFDYSGVI